VVEATGKAAKVAVAIDLPTDHGPAPEVADRSTRVSRRHERRAARAARQWTLWDAVQHYSTVNLLIAVALAVLASGPAALWVRHQTPTYESSATLLIGQPLQVAASTDEGVVAKLNLLRNKYATLVGTEVISGPVAQRLRLNEGVVAAAARSTPVSNSLVLVVSADSVNAREAQRIAGGLADQVRTFAANEQADQAVPTNERYTFTVVQPATAPVQVSPTRTREIEVAIIAGLLALGLFYSALQIVTASIRMR
jgi:capsular polysaccharide biosynthesis protein